MIRDHIHSRDRQRDHTPQEGGVDRGVVQVECAARVETARPARVPPVRARPALGQHHHLGPQGDQISVPKTKHPILLPKMRLRLMDTHRKTKRMIGQVVRRWYEASLLASSSVVLLNRVARTRLA